MDGQTRGICPLSPPTYQLSLIFQTLPIYPGLLSEKVLTFKRVILGNGTHPCFPSALQLSGLCVSPAFLPCMPFQLKCTWVESGTFLIVVLLILKAQREPHLFWASQNSLYNQSLWLFKQSQLVCFRAQLSKRPHFLRKAIPSNSLALSFRSNYLSDCVLDATRDPEMSYTQVLPTRSL